jgi:hypothetical protein
MSSQEHPASPQNLVYCDERTGELRPLDAALEASRLNVLTYERHLEIIATYGMEDRGGGDGLWPL